MTVGPDFTREMRPEEESEIDALLKSAFGIADEADIVRQLRSDGDIWLELVQPWEGVIAGYAALSRMKSPKNWACLAPVAVLPRFQRGAAAPESGLRRAYAVGTRLVHFIASAAQSASDIRASGCDVPATVVVLGRPEFYERAGFSLARAQRLTSPFPISHTLIARQGDDVPVEELVYPAAFQREVQAKR